jgi:5'-methylthioadenosine phosphorylase
MTNYPESYLARELEMCYVNISLITDYDVGLEGVAGIKPVSHAEVIEVFASNNERVKEGIFKIVEAIPAERTCGCGSALQGAR